MDGPSFLGSLAGDFAKKHIDWFFDATKTDLAEQKKILRQLEQGILGVPVNFLPEDHAQIVDEMAKANRKEIHLVENKDSEKNDT